LQPYDNPVKNQVRSWGFRSLDRSFPTELAGKHALYLPGEQNLEGPLFAERNMIAHPVEHSRAVLHRLSNPRVSRHPLKRRQVFFGSLGEAILYHAQRGTPRLAMVSADFEGKVDTCAEELIDLFRIFPERDGGFLNVTTFANLDGQSVEDGIVFTNIFNNLLAGEVKRGMEKLYAQLLKYLTKHAQPEKILCHAQICRDFSLLWRILLGIILFDHPQETPGTVDVSRHAQITQLVGEMHRESLSILLRTGHSTSMRFFQQRGLVELFERYRTTILPVSLERILYKSQGHNRMSTWFLSFGRLHGEIPLTDVANQLWQLYSLSPLVYINEGKPEIY